jgi:hypothetical protein
MGAHAGGKMWLEDAACNKLAELALNDLQVTHSALLLQRLVRSRKAKRHAKNVAGAARRWPATSWARRWPAAAVLRRPCAAPPCTRPSSRCQLAAFAVQQMCKAPSTVTDFGTDPLCAAGSARQPGGDHAREGAAGDDV